MAQNLRKSNFYLFFDKWSLIFNQSKISKFLLHRFLGNIVAHIQAKFQKDEIKLRKPNWFEKKLTYGRRGSDEGRLGLA